MTSHPVARLWSYSFSILVSLALLPTEMAFCPLHAQAQERQVEGYVTAVAMPDGFDLNGEHVTLKPETTYGVIGERAKSGTHASASEVRVGRFVRVAGTDDMAAKRSMVAASVLFRDDWDKTLSGFAVIERVWAAGAEPVFQADGYQIHVTPATETGFAGNLKTLADVGPNTWIHYQGKRDEQGMVVASRARFVPARGWSRLNPRPKTHPVQEPVPAEGALMDSDGKMADIHSKVRYGDSEGYCGWYRLSADQALQQRILRIGQRLIPAYQRQLGDDEAAKVWFRFYVTEEDSVRSDVPCNRGLILIPAQAVARLGNDDQVAALLASGIAFHMQGESAQLMVENREWLGAEVTAAAVSLGGGLLLGTTGGLLVQHHIEAKLEEQRGRMALALMADAGYDPWQAPEAWRRLAAKKLPKDLSKLKYPNRAGYQLGILNLQYSAAKAAEAGSR